MHTLIAAASDTVAEGLGVAGEQAGYTTNLELTSIVANIINAVLGLTGIVFVILVVYAGFLYLTAAGSEENVKKAKKLLTNSVIGIILIVAAYAIAKYVFAALTTVTGG